MEWMGFPVGKNKTILEVKLQKNTQKQKCNVTKEQFVMFRHRPGGHELNCSCVKTWPHTCVVVVELDVAVLLSRDGDGESRVTQHFVNLTGRTWRGTNKQDKSF